MVTIPKARWGSGDEALTAADIDGAERQETRKRYSGPLPTAGTYRFEIQSVKCDQSAAGNPKAVVFATLDGTWMDNHKQYDGAPIWDHLPVMKSTQERVANFTDAIGATGKDFQNAVVDENGYITKMGSVGDPKGIYVYINVTRKRTTKEYPEPSIQVGFNGYIAVSEDDMDPVSDDDSDGEEPPF